jgi:hypothetical protein
MYVCMYVCMLLESTAYCYACCVFCKTIQPFIHEHIGIKLKNIRVYEGIVNRTGIDQMNKKCQINKK